jgi:hypothetical protein
VTDPHARNAGVALTALVASTTTLVCCVLPALLVSLGAGAAVVGLVTAVPQLVWLSEHKALVFGGAALIVMMSGIALWRARTLPCPAEPELARSCMRLRRLSAVVFAVAVAFLLLGSGFAFLG